MLRDPHIQKKYAANYRFQSIERKRTDLVITLAMHFLLGWCIKHSPSCLIFSIFRQSIFGMRKPSLRRASATASLGEERLITATYSFMYQNTTCTSSETSLTAKFLELWGRNEEFFVWTRVILFLYGTYIHIKTSGVIAPICKMILSPLCTCTDWILQSRSKSPRKFVG